MQIVDRQNEPSSGTGIFLMRFILNIGWLATLVIISYVYDRLLTINQFTKDLVLTIPWYKGFIIEYAPFLIIQSILHWFTLKHFFPQQRDGNIVWVIMMPILFLFVYGLLALIIFTLAVGAGRLD